MKKDCQSSETDATSFLKVHLDLGVNAVALDI